MAHSDGWGRSGRALGAGKDAAPFRSPREILGEPPNTRAELRAWIERELGYRIASRALVPGHQSPLECLCHSFFEGGAGADADAQAPEPASADCIVWANRGGGKTWLGALATLLDLLFKPGIQVRILGGSLEQSLRMRASLAGFLMQDRLAEIPHHLAARRITVFHDPDKRTKSIAEVLAASQTSVRGTRVQKLRCDEVELFDPEVWEAAQLVTRSMPCKGPWGKTVRGSIEALSTMHRPFGLMSSIVGPQSDESALGVRRPRGAMRTTIRWGALDVLEFCGDEHACDACILFPECEGRAKTQLTPTTGGHLAIADAAMMKARSSKESWESEMLCLRPSRRDTVYPMFDAATHVVGDSQACPKRFERFIGGMDFGYRSEGVLLLAGVDHDGNVTVLREHARVGSLLEEFVATLERWLASGVADRARFDFLGVDPAGAAINEQSGKANIKVLRERGFRVLSRKSYTREGIGLVKDRIAPADGARPRLHIHHSCIRLIECLTRYRYNDNNKESIEPMKDGNDHAPDALRYMILNLDAAQRFTVDQY